MLSGNIRLHTDLTIKHMLGYKAFSIASYKAKADG